MALASVGFRNRVPRSRECFQVEEVEKRCYLGGQATVRSAIINAVVGLCCDLQLAMAKQIQRPESPNDFFFHQPQGPQKTHARQRGTDSGRANPGRVPVTGSGIAWRFIGSRCVWEPSALLIHAVGGVFVKCLSKCTRSNLLHLFKPQMIHFEVLGLAGATTHVTLFEFKTRFKCF